MNLIKPFWPDTLNTWMYIMYKCSEGCSRSGFGWIWRSALGHGPAVKARLSSLSRLWPASLTFASRIYLGLFFLFSIHAMFPVPLAAMPLPSIIFPTLCLTVAKGEVGSGLPAQTFVDATITIKVFAAMKSISALIFKESVCCKTWIYFSKKMCSKTNLCPVFDLNIYWAETLWEHVWRELTEMWNMTKSSQPNAAFFLRTPGHMSSCPQKKHWTWK